MSEAVAENEAEGRSEEGALTLADLERAFTRVCLDREPREEDLAALHADPARWVMYRGMVRSRLFAMARMGLPRTAELLGAARFDAAVTAYLAESGPASRFLRDVVYELVAHALPGWEADAGLPPHLADLVRFEETKWRVGSLERDLEGAVAELSFEEPAVFEPTLRALWVRHRVDKDGHAPEPLEPHLVLVYRRGESTRVFTYVLNQVGGQLFEAWREGGSCADGVRRMLAATGRAPDARFVDGMAGVLADLVAHGVVLGSPAP